VRKKKKRIMAPGEMEELVLTKDSFTDKGFVREIVICVEDQ